MSKPSNLQILADVQDLLPDVQCVYLFGSHAKGVATAHSDIDIAVQSLAPLEPLQRWEVAEALAARWGCDVDLVDCLQASTVLRWQIVQDGCCLFSVGGAAAQFEMTTLSMYQHLQQERSAILEQWSQGRGQQHA